MADEEKKRLETVSLRLAIIVGSTIAAAFTLMQFVVNSGDKSSEHAHELAMMIAKQIDTQHEDDRKDRAETIQALREQSAEIRLLSETLRSAYHLPPRRPLRPDPRRSVETSAQGASQ